MRLFERFLRRHKVAVIILNIIVALLWIPAFIYSFFKKPEHADVRSLPSPPAASPPVSPAPTPSPPAASPPISPAPTPSPHQEQDSSRKQEPTEEVKEVNEKRKSVVKEKSDQKKKDAGRSVKEEGVSAKEAKEEKPPKGPFGFSCNPGSCYMFDVSTGKRYNSGDIIQGWRIKEITIHGAVLSKGHKEVRVGVE